MRKKQYILSGNFPMGSFENIYLHRANKYKGFLATTFYESNQDLNLILNAFVDSEKDWKKFKGDLELSFYDDSVLVFREQFLNVCIANISWSDLDFSSCELTMIEIDWHYDFKVTRK